MSDSDRKEIGQIELINNRCDTSASISVALDYGEVVNLRLCDVSIGLTPATAREIAQMLLTAAAGSGDQNAAKVKQIEPTPLMPSERLLREILADSVAERISLSDVVVVWSDEDGMTHARRAGETRQ